MNYDYHYMQSNFDAFCVPGLGLLVLLIPVNGVVMKKLGGLQTDIMAAKDKRIKIINEVLNGMKASLCH
jgi:hypothetical protein